MASERRKLLVTLEIEVSALTGDALKEAGFFECSADEGDDEPTNSLDDYSADEIGAVLECDEPDLWVEFFGGSGLYVQFEKVTVVSSDWYAAKAPA